MRRWITRRPDCVSCGGPEQEALLTAVASSIVQPLNTILTININFIFDLERAKISAIFHLERILHRVLGLPPGALGGSPNEIWGMDRFAAAERSRHMSGWVVPGATEAAAP